MHGANGGLAQRADEIHAHSRNVEQALTGPRAAVSVRAADVPRRGGVAEDLIGYDALTQDAMRGVVRAALSRAASQKSLPGKHHFYITFRTRAPGVVIPEHLTARYPDDMTIVLEHQFWDLEVFPDRFRVILKFNGQPSPIVIPFAALTRFYDPSVRFGLQFEAQTADARAEEEAPPQQPPAQAAVGVDREPRPAPAQAAVVSLDAFRKNK
jgi:hypothetical protein